MDQKAQLKMAIVKQHNSDLLGNGKYKNGTEIIRTDDCQNTYKLNRKNANKKKMQSVGKLDFPISPIQNLAISAQATPANVNAIAQNFVDNPSYFPEEIQVDPKFQDRLKREVPLGRLVSASGDASFVAYLCSEAANCFVGQVFPVCGGCILGDAYAFMHC